MSGKALISVVCCALGLTLLPSAASGNALVNKLAADACRAEKSKLGKKAFAKRYGAKKPVRACAKRTRPKARAAVSDANDECLFELEEYGDEEFYLEWGTFSACVADYAAWIMDGGGFEEEEDGDEDEGDLF